MITALVLALAMQAPAPDAPAAPASTPAAAVQATTPDDGAVDLDQLRQLYANTCLAREYGAYDDMCDQLHQQVRQAERRAARAKRSARPAAAAPGKPPG